MAEKNVKFYKTKDGTIVVCKDEFARQQIEQLQGIWEAIEELPDGQAVSAQVAIHTTEIAALQNGKANINGSYDSMTVGMAKNVEATSEISGTSLYRPTAGNADVADGVAKVRSIKGNSIAWNQMVQNPTFANNGEGWIVGNATVTFSNGVATITAQNNTPALTKEVYMINGHKYYGSAIIKSGDVNAKRLAISGVNVGFSSGTDKQLVSGIIDWSFNSGNWTFSVYDLAPSDFQPFTVESFRLFDLTLMFGAGNEPSSVAEFETWLQNNIGLQNYYPYNPGKLLAAKLLGLKTVGFNQWDEEWEVGAISSDGTIDTSLTSRRTTSLIKVFENTDYYIPSQCFSGRYCWYDANMEIVLIDMSSGFYKNVNKSPAKASYLRITLPTTYGRVYNHDICINLHYTNGRDGEYEPYVEHQYNFDTSKVYGKLNDEGNYVQVFPDGMKSAGSVRDELIINDGASKVIKRVGSVDLGSLPYSYSGEYFRSTSLEPATHASNAHGICSKYAVTTLQALSRDDDKTIGIAATTIFVRDTAYTDATTFMAAMQGVMLYYELAEPVEYTDLVYRDNGVDTPIDALNIQVSNYGTEEQIVESSTNGEPNSCAATLDILYGVNAADFMDSANNGAFVSKASLDALCNTLGSALGGTLTSTWNSAEGHYDFTFTPATRQIENPENNE